MTENADAVEMFRRVATSEGVSHREMESAMRIYRVPWKERAELADRVLMMAARYLKQMKAKRDKDA